ncbi:hypothetical protein D3C72_1616190 [compost metagenome]
MVHAMKGAALLVAIGRLRGIGHLNQLDLELAQIAKPDIHGDHHRLTAIFPLQGNVPKDSPWPDTEMLLPASDALLQVIDEIADLVYRAEESTAHDNSLHVMSVGKEPPRAIGSCTRATSDRGTRFPRLDGCANAGHSSSDDQHICRIVPRWHSGAVDYQFIRMDSEPHGFPFPVEECTTAAAD